MHTDRTRESPPSRSSPPGPGASRSDARDATRARPSCAGMMRGAGPPRPSARLIMASPEWLTHRPFDDIRGFIDLHIDDMCDIGKPVSGMDGRVRRIVGSERSRPNAALAGSGLANLFESQVEQHLTEGRLVCVLEESCPYHPGLPLHYPSRHQRPAARRAFIDCLRGERVVLRAGRNGPLRPIVFSHEISFSSRPMSWLHQAPSRSP